VRLHAQLTLTANPIVVTEEFTHFVVAVLLVPDARVTVVAKSHRAFFLQG
jgi:hypothetical protein